MLLHLNLFALKDKEDEETKEVFPAHVYIPFGQFLLLKGDFIHLGSFGSPCNIRLHILFKKRTTSSKSLYFISNKHNKQFPSATECKRNIFEVADRDPEYIPKFLNQIGIAEEHLENLNSSIKNRPIVQDDI